MDRPREKIQDKGPESLSDLELMAILLGRGIEGNDVFSLANHVLRNKWEQMGSGIDH